ncbi:hypothetical protein JW865_03050 [Candidatus Bathyarchaeota archaeon]|nr:hypothetical protein [Candidatus Bathyarchaeota archaeon]
MKENYREIVLLSLSLILILFTSYSFIDIITPVTKSTHFLSCEERATHIIEGKVIKIEIKEVEPIEGVLTYDHFATIEVYNSSKKIGSDTIILQYMEACFMPGSCMFLKEGEIIKIYAIQIDDTNFVSYCFRHIKN